MSGHDQALIYLASATEDEAVLDQIVHSSAVSDAMVGFHLQQSAEKTIKAVLSQKGVRFRRTHDLRELMDLLKDNGCPVPAEVSDIDRLTAFATVFRYGALPITVSLDRERTREQIRELRQWAGRLVAESQA